MELVPASLWGQKPLIITKSWYQALFPLPPPSRLQAWIPLPAVIAGTALVLKNEAGGPESEMTEFGIIPKGVRVGKNKRNKRHAGNMKKMLVL
ncbi:hypothetical protein ADUPG1_007304 [Aduncisulcus paluster]|uniref:Uncharacterized protein n=1 Tax=Aduncisulcus paluster TaxID=2918883 RepID=A0ABQ5KPW4_9EUKA|nr:hypothetical protein ADUPG1_011456 [Aduncisulcus paluster]GKT33374.1 hypothetical protein ADUPG1_007304 [Aduncisulcus paluster]